MKYVRSSSLLSLTILAAVAVGCSDAGDDATTPARPEGAETETVKLALVGSFSGADGAVAEDVQRGVVTAVNQINALGGILGRRLALEVADDASTPATTAARVEELADAGVVFGVGPSTSRAAHEILPLVASDRVLYISPSATGLDLDCVDRGATADETARLCETRRASVDLKTGTFTPVLFRTTASDAFLATAIAQYASQSVDGLRRCSSIAIVHQNDDHDAQLAERVRSRYLQLSLGVRRTVQLEETDTELGLRAAAEAVALSPVPECQIVVARPGLAAAYMQAFKAFQTDHPTALPESFETIGGDGFLDETFAFAPQAKDASDGSLAVASDTTPNTQEFNAFASVFESTFPGVTPGRFAAPAYDAVIMLAGAMTKAHTTTSIPDVRRALLELSNGRRRATNVKMNEFFSLAAAGENIDYEGASGQLDFDARTGGVRNTFGVWRIKQSSLVREASFDASVITGD